MVRAHVACGNLALGCFDWPKGGGLSSVAEVAAKAVQELEQDISDVPIIVAFDPFVFGLYDDDIDIAPTLTAMLKVLRQLPSNDEYLT